MVEFPTFKGSWPWPWIGLYCIPSCISHRPLPTYQISLKSKKLFVDGRTDVRTSGRTFETGFIRSTRKSRPKKSWAVIIVTGSLWFSVAHHYRDSRDAIWWWIPWLTLLYAGDSSKNAQLNYCRERGVSEVYHTSSAGCGYKALCRCEHDPWNECSLIIFCMSPSTEYNSSSI